MRVGPPERVGVGHRAGEEAAQAGEEATQADGAGSHPEAADWAQPREAAGEVALCTGPRLPCLLPNISRDTFSQRREDVRFWRSLCGHVPQSACLSRITVPFSSMPKTVAHFNHLNILPVHGLKLLDPSCTGSSGAPGICANLGTAPSSLRFITTIC